MASEWKTVPLGDLYEFDSGLSKPRSAFGSGFPFLSFTDVFYNVFVPSQLSELVNATEHERKTRSIRRGDVFLTRTSETNDELGMSCVALTDIPEATFNGFTKRLRPKSSDVVVPEYAGYYFRGPTFRAAVTAMSSLSTRASLNNAMLARLAIAFPGADEQAAIGHVLKAFDDKIELNRRTNETLEAVAQTIFRSWFVNCDPVRAKVEGRDTGLPQDIADLFPNSFEDSELGECPRGWKVGSFGDFISQRTERVGRRDVVVLSAVASGTLVRSDEHFTKRVYSKETNKYLLVEQWDLAFNPSRINIGSIGMLEAPLCGGVSPVYVVLRPQPDYRWFTAFAVRLPQTKAWLDTLASGSVRQSVSFNTFASIPCIVPSLAVLREFNRQWEQLRAGIRAREGQSEILTALRDTLLPKLISGELRLKHLERIVENVL